MLSLEVEDCSNWLLIFLPMNIIFFKISKFIPLDSLLETKGKVIFIGNNFF